MRSTDFRIVPEAARVDPEWAVIDRIWTELRTPYEPDERLAHLTPGQSAVYALTWTRSEVGNGGFDQYLSNSTAYLLPEAIQGADLLGSPAWADLLRRVRALFSEPFPLDRTQRQEALDNLSAADRELLRRLDDELYQLDDEPDSSLGALMRAYIDSHPHDFFVPAADEEEAAAALLDGAREIVSSRPPRRLELAANLLREAIERSRQQGTGKTADLAESLLRQLPDLQSCIASPLESQG